MSEEPLAELLDYCRQQIRDGYDLSVTNAEAKRLFELIDSPPVCDSCAATISTCVVCDQPVEVAA
jgi:hypothetical protein